MSKRIEVSVTPTVISWARENAGYSIEEATKSFRQIVNWENGKSLPTYHELEIMAKKFECSLVVFFLSEPPNVEPIKNSFRTLPTKEKNNLSVQIVKMLKRAKFFQYNIEELLKSQDIKKSSLIDKIIANKNNIADTAIKLRKVINVPIEDQVRWNNHETALKKWIEKIEEHGVFVFKDSFRDNDYSGFCLYDENYPIIYINNSNDKRRQIFTLFHEIAHLLFRTGGIDKTRDLSFLKTLEDNHVEVLCNKFAAEFLVPAKHFKDNFFNINHIDDDSILEIAKHYSVSRYVVLRRCFDLGKIGKSFYDEKTSEYNKQEGSQVPDELKGMKPYALQKNYHSDYYLNILFQSYYEHKIDDIQLSQYLISVGDVDKFRQLYMPRLSI